MGSHLFLGRMSLTCSLATAAHTHPGRPRVRCGDPQRWLGQQSACVGVTPVCRHVRQSRAPCLHPTCQPHALLGRLAGPSEAEGGMHPRAFQRVYLKSHKLGVLANIPNHAGGPADGVMGLSGPRPSLGSCPSQWGQCASAQKTRDLTSLLPRLVPPAVPHTPSLCLGTGCCALENAFPLRHRPPSSRHLFTVTLNAIVPWPGSCLSVPSQECHPLGWSGSALWPPAVPDRWWH